MNAGEYIAEPIKSSRWAYGAEDCVCIYVSGGAEPNNFLT